MPSFPPMDSERPRRPTEDAWAYGRPLAPDLALREACRSQSGRREAQGRSGPAHALGRFTSATAASSDGRYSPGAIAACSG